MKTTFARIFLPLLIVGIAFAVYIFVQPAGPTGSGTSRELPPPTTLRSGDEVMGISSGQGVWMAQYDEKTGELVSRFKADEYAPQKNDTVDVTNAAAEFVLADGQVLRVLGKRGSVVVPRAVSASNKMHLRGQARLPSRGRLEDVTIYVQKSIDSVAAPTLTATMNNVTFDNDTFRIYTDDFTDAAGQRVLGRDVPLHVTGEYEFDGYGLIVRWNQRDRHLERLEINRGERLVIKNTGKFAPGILQKTQGREGSARSPWHDVRTLATVKIDRPAPPPSDPLPMMLAGASDLATGQALASTSPAGQQALEGLLYRVTLFDDVVLTQSTATHVTAERMTIDFNPANQRPSHTPAATPATEDTKSSTPQPAESSQAGAQDTGSRSEPAGILDPPSRTPIEPTTGRAAPAIVDVASPDAARPSTPLNDARDEQPPSAQSTSAPSTQPADPLVITWTGKLVVEPLRGADALQSIAPQQSVVVLTGNPVTFRSPESGGSCTVLKYATEHQAVDLTGSTDVPVTLQDASGTKIVTQFIRYDDANHRATLAGATHLSALTKSDTGTDQPFEAHWSGDCELTLRPTQDSGALSAERAHLRGDVRLLHPEVNLTCDDLIIAFAEQDDGTARAVATSQPEGTSIDGANVESLTASGHVNCSIKGEAGVTQSIKAGTLSLTSARDESGRLYPATLKASENVVASDATQSLATDVLTATLASPAESEATANQQASRDARDNASDRLRSGQSNLLRELSAIGHVQVKGVDDQTASADELWMTTSDTGPIIVLRGQSPATVTGREGRLTGAMIRVQPELQSAQVEGAGSLRTQLAGTGDAEKSVDVTWSKSLDFDGTINLATIDGDIVINHPSNDGSINTLRGGRVTLTMSDPATQPAAVDEPIPPATQASALQGPFQQKSLKSARIDTGVEMTSVLSDEAGNILRQVNLFAEAVDYDPVNKRVTVPVPGKLFYADLRQEALPEGAKANPLAGKEGNTAVAWQKSAVVDELKHTATLTGQVVIVHAGLEENAPKIRLDADEVIADFLPAEEGQRRSELTRLQALGSPMRFTGRGMRFDAASVVFDPATQVATARGSDTVQAMLYDERALSQGTFSELHYNVRTEQMDARDFRATARRESGVELRK